MEDKFPLNFMKRRSYPSDLTDAEWSIIEPLLSEPKNQGRKRETELREVVNAIFYLLSEGCQWRALPHDFPHWSTVRTYFDKWKRKKVWSQLNKYLREKLRVELERNAQPSAASIDSQSVKTTEKRGKYSVTMEEKRLKEESVIY
jgi:putative transposase